MITHRISLIIVIAFSCIVACSAFGRTYDPIGQLYDGQCYGDTIHYRVIGSNPMRYYDVISETNFLLKLTKRGYFLYRWDYTVEGAKQFFTFDDNVYVGADTKHSETTKAIEAAGLSVFSSHTNVISDSAILKLFPETEVAAGFVMGVVDKACTRVYDITSRAEEYMRKGSRIDYDGVYYETTSGDITGSSVVKLEKIGLQAFYEDLIAGQKYIEEKNKEEEETEQTLKDPSITNVTETVAFTNIIITSYYTNTTVIVDPYFKNLNSVLKFTYPKYATEGGYIMYTFDRMGTCVYPLTIHVITNGHWCANVRWEANEDGKKQVRVKIGISDDFNDNFPLEVLVKTLNRNIVTTL